MNRLLIMICFSVIFTPLALSQHANIPIDQLVDGQGVQTNNNEHNEKLNLDETGSYIAELIPIIVAINLAMAGATTAFGALVLTIADYKRLTKEKRAKTIRSLNEETEKLADEVQKASAKIKPITTIHFTSSISYKDLLELQSVKTKFEEAIRKADELGSAAKKFAEAEDQILQEEARKFSESTPTLFGVLSLGIAPLVRKYKERKLTSDAKNEKAQERLKASQKHYIDNWGRVSREIMAKAQTAEENANKIKSSAAEGIKSVDEIIRNNTQTK